MTTETPSTCAAAGSKVVKCSVCGTVQSNTAIPATGVHTWVQTGHADATCGAAGYTNYSCSVCGVVMTETIPATGAHTWTDITTVVHHDEVGHYDPVTVVDQAAWDETVMVTEYEVTEIFGTHYDGFESYNLDEVKAHIEALRASINWAALSDEEALQVLSSLSWYSSPREIPHQVPTVVHHDAVTHVEQVYVMDAAAWDETVVTGHRCSVCGAVQ